MIHSVTVTNYLGENLVLDLTNPERSGLAIVNITGLGPTAGNISITKWASSDGGVFNSARVDTRNIVFSLRFMDVPVSIETNRQMSYRFFMPKRKVKLTFETDNRKCYIEGYVERNEPQIFSQRSGQMISILCPDPYFIKVKDDPTEGLVTFSNVEPMFELWSYFPDTGADYDRGSTGISNESLSEPAILIGDILASSMRELSYTGDAETGIIVTIEASGRVVNPSIVHSSYDISASFNIVLEEGDILEYCSIRGRQYARLTHGDVESNVISKLQRPIAWIQLQPGANEFSYFADEGRDFISITIKHDVLYGGI